MLSYEETMRFGAGEYADVTGALGALGLPATFTQTGGMCAAIEVQLEAGYTLLITDAEDTLSWCRADQSGWWVGLYPPGDHDGPIADRQIETNEISSLLAVVDGVLLDRGARRG